MVTLKFDDFIASLDSLKQMFYLAEYVKRAGNPVALREKACELQLKLRELADMPASQMMWSVSHAPEFNYVSAPYVSVSLSQQGIWGELGVEFERILEHHRNIDSPFYADAGFAKFWNEVENPLFVERLFARAASELKELWTGRLVDAESELSREDIKDGMCAISYYDVGDLALVFTSQADAEAFSEAYPVDPSEFMSAKDGCWFCF